MISLFEFILLSLIVCSAVLATVYLNRIMKKKGYKVNELLNILAVLTVSIALCLIGPSVAWIIKGVAFALILLYASVEDNTVEWRCTRKFLQGFTSPEMSLHTGSIKNMPFLDKFGVNTRFARRCALELVKTMLDDGFYVAFSGVDDYYVKGKSWYQEQHYYHDGLIIGYDDDNETLAIAAYDQRWIFTVFNTPQEGFLKGLQSMCEQSLYGGLHAVRARDEKQELNIKTIYDAIKGYISSNIETYLLTDDAYPFKKDLIGIGACIENILLSATEKNYGSCVIGELYDKQIEIAQHINVNTNGYKLICGIVIGRSAEAIIDRVPLDSLDYVIGSVE